MTSITKNAVVTMHYTLFNETGEQLESSKNSDPLAYLHGHGNIIPGLEKALEGKSAGDSLRVDVEPEEGYGARDEALIQEVPRSMFQGFDQQIEVGMRFQADSSHGPTLVTVTAVSEEMITVDGNNELAGEKLTFDIEILEVREASAEELDHGHVHGPGGHHH
ncbi:MAG: peptidylprolyl isomerase [Gammaproteobacteria bacterium]|nr:peptidylprolyl isomerase [Gammaproteobacteria bacterium]